MQDSYKKSTDKRESYYWLTLALVLLLPIWGFWMVNEGALFRPDAPEGQTLYLLSKLMGLVAFTLLAWQVVTALLSKFVSMPHLFRAGKHTHILLGFLLVFFLLAHSGLFVAAASSRTGHLALEILVPSLGGGYYEVALSLGVIALFLIVIAVGAGVMRSYLSGGWRMGHALVALAFVLVFFHAYSIGSELQADIFQPIFWGIIAVFVTVILMRGLTYIRR